MVQKTWQSKLITISVADKLEAGTKNKDKVTLRRILSIAPPGIQLNCYYFYINKWKKFCAVLEYNISSINKNNIPTNQPTITQKPSWHEIMK